MTLKVTHRVLFILLNILFVLVHTLLRSCCLRCFVEKRALFVTLSRQVDWLLICLFWLWYISIDFWHRRFRNNYPRFNHLLMGSAHKSSTSLCISTHISLFCLFTLDLFWLDHREFFNHYWLEHSIFRAVSVQSVLMFC